MKKILFALAALISVSGGTITSRPENRPSFTEVTEAMSAKTDSVLNSSMRLQEAANHLERSTY